MEQEDYKTKYTELFNNYLITAKHYEDVISQNKQLQKRVQELESEVKKWKELTSSAK